MTNEELKVVAQKFKVDFPLYAKNVLRVVTKDGELVPFKLNQAQKLVHAKLDKQLKETGRVRALVLKARQVGISTYIEGRLFWRTTQTRNANAFVLSHLAESTNSIFQMVSTFYDNVPHKAFQPSLTSRSAQTLLFQDINSRYRVGTARSAQTGRSQTNRFVHGSEVAFYPQGQDIVAGLLQSVGDKDTEVILESTANGAGGWFYEQVMKSLRGESEWIVCFVPWFVMDEYRRKLRPYFERTTEEEALSEKYDLDDEQLQFRRDKIDELGSLDLFRQEYPSNEMEAFLTSGRCFVEDNVLSAAEEECYTPDFIGELSQSQLYERDSGPYREWHRPMDNESYVIGADIAEGLSHGDYSCAQVLDARGRQVACYHGHVDPWEFGEILSQLGQRYNGAYMVVERNNHGLTTLRRLQEINYPSMFVESSVDGAYGDKMTKRGGFLTTSKTKPLIIDNLAALIRQRDAGVADVHLIRELRTYVINEKGATNAQSGCYDDRVMAFAIALHGLATMPRPKRLLAPRRFEAVDTVVGY